MCIHCSTHGDLISTGLVEDLDLVQRRGVELLGLLGLHATPAPVCFLEADPPRLGLHRLRDGRRHPVLIAHVGLQVLEHWSVVGFWDLGPPGSPLQTK